MPLEYLHNRISGLLADEARPSELIRNENCILLHHQNLRKITVIHKDLSFPVLFPVLLGFQHGEGKLNTYRMHYEEDTSAQRGKPQHEE